MPDMPDALILCGGVGSRLRETIGESPKSLASIAGRPFLELLLSQLRRNGFQRAIMAVGYQKDMIRTHFGARVGFLELIYSEESSALGTGGAVRNGLPLVHSHDVLIMNGDSYTDIDLASFVEKHCESGADISIALVPIDGRSDCGNVRINSENSVVSFEEKQRSSSDVYVNAGIYLIARKVLEAIPGGVQLSIERKLFPSWLEDGLLVKGFLYPATCVDIGTPERYRAAQATLAAAELQDTACIKGC